jgi:hypothetical protein
MVGPVRVVGGGHDANGGMTVVCGDGLTIFGEGIGRFGLGLGLGLQDGGLELDLGLVKLQQGTWPHAWRSAARARRRHMAFQRRQGGNYLMGCGFSFYGLWHTRCKEQG